MWGETIFFDNASLLKRIGASIDIPPPSGEMKPATFRAWTIPARWARVLISFKHDKVEFVIAGLDPAIPSFSQEDGRAGQARA